MIFEDPLPEPTPEMVQNYEDRTARHIKLVADNLLQLANHREDAQELQQRAETHDQSKYGSEERLPYIWLTEFHRCKNDGLPFEYPPGVQETVRGATWHHISTNSHHPEAHDSPTDMRELDLIEMVCDWTAMAQELGENGGSAKSWADKNIGSKWEFDEQQVKFIYRIIEELDSLNSQIRQEQLH
jgi:hypothetical protein